MSKCEYLSPASLFRHSWDTALLSGEEKPQSQLKFLGQIFFFLFILKESLQLNRKVMPATLERLVFFIAVLLSNLTSFLSDIRAVYSVGLRVNPLKAQSMVVALAYFLNGAIFTSHLTCRA